MLIFVKRTSALALQFMIEISAIIDAYTFTALVPVECHQSRQSSSATSAVATFPTARTPAPSRFRACVTIISIVSETQNSQLIVSSCQSFEWFGKLQTKPSAHLY